MTEKRASQELEGVVSRLKEIPRHMHKVYCWAYLTEAIATAKSLRSVRSTVALLNRALDEVTP